MSGDEECLFHGMTLWQCFEQACWKAGLEKLLCIVWQIDGPMHIFKMYIGVCLYVSFHFCFVCLLSCCLTSTEAGWPIRDGLFAWFIIFKNNPLCVFYAVGQIMTQNKRNWAHTLDVSCCRHRMGIHYDLRCCRQLFQRHRKAVHYDLRCCRQTFQRHRKAVHLGCCYLQRLAYSVCWNLTLAEAVDMLCLAIVCLL